jgi:signal transduction histidine kinase
VQAGLARRLVPTRPDDAVEAIMRVEQSAREATNDLRRLLGVLREDQPDELSPAPGIRELESLAEDHGAHVTLSVSGDPDSLADSLKLTIFRIVQESLTNARKHAPGAPVRVSVSEDDGGATIAVANAASTVAERGAGTSWGLTGLRERVEMYGGELHAGRTDSGGFELRVRL